MAGKEYVYHEFIGFDLITNDVYHFSDEDELTEFVVELNDEEFEDFAFYTLGSPVEVTKNGVTIEVME